MDIRAVLAFNLRKFRRQAGLSQEELAHRAELDRTYISSLERSLYSASIDVVDKIAMVLGVATHEMLVRPPQSDRTRKGVS